MDSRKKMFLFGGIAAAVIVIAVVLIVVLKPSTGNESYRSIEVLEAVGENVVYRNDKEIAAYESMKLRSGDTLSVNEGGYLRMRLDEDKYVYLEGAALIQLIAEGDAKDSKTIINAELGTIVTEVQNKLSENSSFEINAPNTTMAIRGTITVVKVGYDLKEQKDSVSQDALLQFLLDRSGYVQTEIEEDADESLTEAFRTLEAAFEQGVDVATSNFVQEGKVEVTAFEKKEDADGKSYLVAVQVPVAAGEGFTKTVAEKDSIPTLVLTQIKQDEDGNWKIDSDNKDLESVLPGVSDDMNIEVQIVESVNELQEVMNTWNITLIMDLNDLGMILNLNSSSISGANLSEQAVWNEMTETSPTPSPSPNPTLSPTPSPSPSPSPSPTEVPEITEEPEPTEVPEITEEPEPTEAPEITEEPEPTEAPEITEEPEPTEEPEITEEPEPTEAPEITETPEPTKEPEPSPSPTPSPSPSPTPSPSPSPTPSPSPSPSPTPGGSTGGNTGGGSSGGSTGGSTGGGNTGGSTGGSTGGGNTGSGTITPPSEPVLSPTPSATPAPAVMPSDNPSVAYITETIEMDGIITGYQLLSVKPEYQTAEIVIIPSSIGPSVSPIPVLEVNTELLAGCTNATAVVVAEGADARMKDSLTEAIAESGINTITVSLDELGVVDFANLTGLKNVNIYVAENGINTLSNQYFKNNANIENVTISGAIYGIEAEAFYGCSELTTVTFDFPETNQAGFYLGDSVFEGCTSLQSIDLTHVAGEIPEKAFSGCSSLSGVVFPQIGYLIDKEAFAGCSALRSVDLGAATYIGNMAFTRCNLTGIKLLTTNTNCATDAFVGGTVFGIESPYVYSETGILYTTAIVGDTGRATIRGYLYKNVTVEDGNYNNLYIPDEVEVVYTDPESGEYFSVSYVVTEIADGAFMGVENIGEVYMYDYLTTIGKQAFAGCTNLTYVFGGNNVTTIGNEAFMNCIKLQSVTMTEAMGDPQWCIIYPFALQSLGTNVFEGCTSLQGALCVVGQESALTINKSLFSGASCVSGLMVDIYSGLTIPSEAFQDLNSLEKVELRHVASIGASAFKNCTGLKEVVLNAMTDMPEAPTIGAKAFYGCSAMTKLDATGNWSIADDAFEGVNVPYTYEYLDDNGVKITGCSIINQNPESLEIPSKIAELDVLEIGAYAFENMTSITEVTLGENVKKIGTSAFDGCTSLQTVQLSNENLTENLTEISTSAFSGCTSLQNIQLPNTLQEIGESAFSGCTSLAEVQLSGENLTEISTSAFSGCTSLAEVQLPSSLTKIGSYAFNNCTFLQTIELPDTLKEIDASAFFKTALTAIRLPDSLEKIGSSAFAYTQLSSVVIPNGVKIIGGNAFANCANLSQIVIPASVEEIGINVFALGEQGSSDRLLTTYLHKELDEKASLNSTFASSGNVKVYAVSGSALTCVTNPIPETQIVKLNDESSMAHDALELEIMQEIGAIDAQYLISNPIIINVPNVASFEYALLQTDAKFDESMLSSISWNTKTGQFSIEPLTNWTILCFKIQETTDSEAIYLVTPKLKQKVQ